MLDYVLLADVLKRWILREYGGSAGLCMIGSNFPFGRELCISVEKMEKSEIAAIGGIYGICVQ